MLFGNVVKRLVLTYAEDSIKFFNYSTACVWEYMGQVGNCGHLSLWGFNKKINLNLIAILLKTKLNWYSCHLQLAVAIKRYVYLYKKIKAFFLVLN